MCDHNIPILDESLKCDGGDYFKHDGKTSRHLTTFEWIKNGRKISGYIHWFEETLEEAGQ